MPRTFCFVTFGCILAPNAKPNVSFTFSGAILKKSWELPKMLLQPSTKLNALVPFENRQKVWEKMQRDVGLTLPDLTRADLGFKPKPAVPFFGRVWANQQVYPALTEHTSSNLISFVFSLNYEQLVALPVVVSRYEVEKVIMGITSTKIGVSIHEIKPESRFADDLGID